MRTNFVSAEAALVANTATTVLAANKALSALRIANKDAALVIYFTDDDSVPSATNGQPIAAGAVFQYPHPYVPTKAIKLFSTGTARYRVTYA